MCLCSLMVCRLDASTLYRPEPCGVDLGVCQARASPGFSSGRGCGVVQRHSGRGSARHYGDPYHGRATANGETFDKNKLTAAHRTLPFNTWVRVQNQLNRKTVDVRINDRSSFVGGHHIDLSEGAARKIEMIRSGVIPVRMEIIKEADSGSRGQ